MTIKSKDVSVNRLDFSGVNKYEVFGPGGLYVSTNMDTASQARKVAMLIWNDSKTQADAEYLIEYGED